MANNATSNYGILVDYEYCTGCHSCEVACKKEHNLPIGQFGIQLSEIGPWKYNEDQWEWVYMPVLTELCDMCEDRVSMGKLPTCVHHCQAFCMHFGPVEDLVKKMDGKNRKCLLTPKL